LVKVGAVINQETQAIGAAEGSEFWERWNNFVRRYGTSGFYFGGFAECYMNASRNAGWTPRLIVGESDGRLVGVAVLQTRGVLGGRTATSSYPRNYGTDFVVDPQYGERFIQNTLRFLFEKLRCQYLDLIMPSESPNLEFLKQASSSLGFQFTSAPLRKEFAEHSVIEVTGTWDEFKRMRGMKFVRRYRDIERLLSKSGNWTTQRIPLDGPEPVRMIETIERNSWKDAWRKERGVSHDPNLPVFFANWTLKSSSGGYLPEVFLLVLNGEPIAYTIVSQLNGVALLCKTSFDKRYAKASPGEYIQNVALQHLFESRGVVRIDFLTALAYLNRWTSLRYTRERVTISRTVPLLSAIVKTVGRSSLAREAYNAIWHRDTVHGGSRPSPAHGESG
jgi:hypothetical protein